MRVDKDLAKEIGSYWESKGLFASTMMEECGELTQAISKVARAKKAYKDELENDGEIFEMKEKLDFAEIDLEREIADMYITLEVLKTYWCLDQRFIQKKIDDKLDIEYEHNI